jgi:hypothetical protein
MPESGVFTGEGVVYEYTNDTDTSVQPEYACVTAREVIECDVEIDDVLIDRVYAGSGGSHSWWTAAGGRLMRYPLNPGQTLRIRLGGPGAFRIDWY